MNTNFFMSTLCLQRLTYNIYIFCFYQNFWRYRCLICIWFSCKKYCWLLVTSNTFMRFRIKCIVTPKFITRKGIYKMYFLWFLLPLYTLKNNLQAYFGTADFPQLSLLLYSGPTNDTPAWESILGNHRISIHPT